MCPYLRKANGSKKAERNSLFPTMMLLSPSEVKEKKIHENWISRRISSLVPSVHQSRKFTTVRISTDEIFFSGSLHNSIVHPTTEASPSLSSSPKYAKTFTQGLVSKSIIKLRQKIIIQWAFLRGDINPNDNSRSIWMTMRKLLKPRSENRDERRKSLTDRIEFEKLFYGWRWILSSSRHDFSTALDWFSIKRYFFLAKR